MTFFAHNIFYKDRKQLTCVPAVGQRESELEVASK